jgi:hypothetical protein
MKTVKFRKAPMLYGASFLLDIFGPNPTVRRRKVRVEADDGKSIREGFRALGADFAKVLSKARRD